MPWVTRSKNANGSLFTFVWSLRVDGILYWDHVLPSMDLKQCFHGCLQCSVGDATFNRAYFDVDNVVHITYPAGSQLALS